MRPLFLAPLLLAGCAASPTVEPREYLDEETAATITVVAEPWIFSRAGASEARDERDFLSVYALDVNRMGDHRQYLAVLQSLPLGEASTGEPSRPTLQLRMSDELLALEASGGDPRSLGIAAPVARAYTMSSRWWYFPLDKHALVRIAQAKEVETRLVVGDQHAPYILWRDGSAEAAALSAAIP